MTTITDPYPLIREFGPGSTYCASGGASGTGCAVCSTAQVIVRWGLPIPRTADGHPDMIALGRSMGQRHRAADSRVRHGLSLVRGQGCSGAYWCAYCATLELQARGLPFEYGNLSWTAIGQRLDARHPIVIPGDGWQVPYVGPSTYSARTPARGRGQRSYSTRPFPHMITGWESAREGTRTVHIVSDPNFGSGRDPVPPHCVYPAPILERFWSALGWGVCYATEPPPDLTQPTPAPPAPSKGDDVRYVMMSGYDVSSAPAVALPKGTRIETLDGEAWATVGPTSVRTVGLADGSSKRRVVIVNTAKFYPDGVKRPTGQVAVLR